MWLSGRLFSSGWLSSHVSSCNTCLSAQCPRWAKSRTMRLGVHNFRLGTGSGEKQRSGRLIKSPAGEMPRYRRERDAVGEMVSSWPSNRQISNSSSDSIPFSISSISPSNPRQEDTCRLFRLELPEVQTVLGQ